MLQAQLSRSQGVPHRFIEESVMEWCLVPLLQIAKPGMAVTPMMVTAAMIIPHPRIMDSVISPTIPVSRGLVQTTQGQSPLSSPGFQDQYLHLFLCQNTLQKTLFQVLLLCHCRPIRCCLSTRPPLPFLVQAGQIIVMRRNRIMLTEYIHFVTQAQQLHLFQGNLTRHLGLDVLYLCCALIRNLYSCRTKLEVYLSPLFLLRCRVILH